MAIYNIYMTRNADLIEVSGRYFLAFFMITARSPAFSLPPALESNSISYYLLLLLALPFVWCPRSPLCAGVRARARACTVHVGRLLQSCLDLLTTVAHKDKLHLQPYVVLTQPDLVRKLIHILAPFEKTTPEKVCLGTVCFSPFRLIFTFLRPFLTLTFFPLADLHRNGTTRAFWRAWRR